MQINAATRIESIAPDPIKHFYQLGYTDAKAGKKHRVPHMYKLAYSNGRSAALTNKPSRYGDE